MLFFFFFISDLLPLFPLPNVVLFPNVFLPLHIFEPRYREMVADAHRQRPDDRHGAAAPGLGARLRGTAADLPGRLQRRHHALRAAARRPLQHRAARARPVPHRSKRITLSYRRAVVEPLPSAASTEEDRAAIRRQRSSWRRCSRRRRSEPARRWLGPTMPASMSDEDMVNALAQYLDFEPLEKQALLEKQMPPRPRRVARRAARDEDHDGAHAGSVERRALTAFRATAALCSPRRVARHEGHEGHEEHEEDLFSPCHAAATG